jgi:hypothetical protein
VLGKGHTLLDLSIADAIGHHRVVDAGEPPGNDGVVASFPSPEGETLTLVRTGASDGARPGRPASLEEVVIGHMAHARRREQHRPDGAAA